MTTIQDTQTAGSEYQPVDGLLLEVEDLFVEFHTPDGVAKAINGVSFELRQGESSRSSVSPAPASP
jgi:oligopeptide transport system ATP-binding protein